MLRTMLASERASIGGGTSVRGATALLAMVQELGIDGDPVVRQEVVAAIARERLLDLTQARIAATAVRYRRPARSPSCSTPNTAGSRPTPPCGSSAPPA